MKTKQTVRNRNRHGNLLQPLLGLRGTFVLLNLIAISLLTAQRASAISSDLVIAEVYGGGGNSGATYKNDFIVIFNRGTSSVDVNGWSVQYASSSGSSWQVTTLAASSTLIPPGGYFLVQEAQGAGGTVDLPTPDANGTIAMSSSSGKVALCNSTTALTGTCPTGGSIIDFVGFGTANCYEGTGATPTLSNTTSAQRAESGCTDTDDNATDFTTGAPDPRNSSSPAHSCGGPAVGPSIITEPQSVIAPVGQTAKLIVVASGTAPLYFQWYKDNAPIGDGGNISGTTNSALTLTGVFHTNQGDYKVVITNSVNSATSQVATVTVVGFAITPIMATNTLTDTPLAVGFGFVDNQTPITGVSAVSGNQTLLPDANVSLSGSGNNRTVTLTPAASQRGAAPVIITAMDGSYTTNLAFSLVVVPSNSVLLNDYFDYIDGSLTANSGGLWQNHSGTLGDLQVISSQVYLSRSLSEDVNAPLIGGPYTNRSGSLYAKFIVNFSSTDTPTAAGSYFAHFKDAEFGYRCRVWASTNSGNLRLGIGNGSGADATSGQFPRDLAYDTPYTVVTRIDLAGATSTIWIDPTNQLDMNVTATDGSPTTNAIDVVSYAFRQGSGMSKLFLDNLVVATSFDAATGLTTPAPPPCPLKIAVVGSDAVLTWTNSVFALQSAPSVTGPYTAVLGATSPHTNAISGQKYFRLKY